MARAGTPTAWTAFLGLLLHALLRVLTAVGLRTAPRPAAHTAAGADAPAPRAAVPACRPAAPPAAAVRDGSLPPTIKQRIRAEAHGSSPSVRRAPRCPESDGPALGATAAAALHGARVPAARSGAPAARVPAGQLAGPGSDIQLPGP